MREGIEDQAARRRVRVREGVRDGLRERAAEAMERTWEGGDLDGSKRKDALARVTHTIAAWLPSRQLEEYRPLCVRDDRDPATILRRHEVLDLTDRSECVRRAVLR